MTKYKIAIIGAGPCGALMANVLGKKSFDVQVFEKRNDIRLSPLEGGRSINLALSNRGIRALEMLPIADEIHKLTIPMFGRCLHQADGSIINAPYSGRKGEFIHSISRSDLNILLLNEIKRYPSVQTFFNHTCEYIDFVKNSMKLNISTNELTEKKFDLLIGADGASSKVRKSLHESPFFNYKYEQEFLNFGYKELILPIGNENEFLLEKNALHIWPRGHFMLIGLPNLDGSFTMTLFLPFHGQGSFQEIEQIGIGQFFKNYFNDLDHLIPDLEQQYLSHPIGHLGTIKTTPWHNQTNALIIGDAAHAIVPFYGQGMNCALEDVHIFTKCLNEMSLDDPRFLNYFQHLRIENTNAIADLAIDNFIEMRDHTSNPIFLRKKKLENILESKFESYFSKYSMVTFRDDLSYAEALKKGRMQDEYLMQLCSIQELEDINLDEVFKKIQNMHVAI